MATSAVVFLNAFVMSDRSSCPSFLFICLSLLHCVSLRQSVNKITDHHSSIFYIENSIVPFDIVRPYYECEKLIITAEIIIWLKIRGKDYLQKGK